MKLNKTLFFLHGVLIPMRKQFYTKKKWILQNAENQRIKSAIEIMVHIIRKLYLHKKNSEKYLKVYNQQWLPYAYLLGRYPLGVLIYRWEHWGQTNSL